MVFSLYLNVFLSGTPQESSVTIMGVSWCILVILTQPYRCFIFINILLI